MRVFRLRASLSDVQFQTEVTQARVATRTRRMFPLQGAHAVAVRGTPARIEELERIFRERALLADESAR
jgi:hypothetical protein